GRVFSFIFTKSTVTASAANLMGEVLRFERFPYDENTVSTIASFINKMTTDDPNVYGVTIITEDKSEIPSSAFPWPVTYTSRSSAQARAELEEESLEKCLFVSWSDSIEASYMDRFLHDIPTFGHMKVTKGVPCTCGGNGCLNAVASGVVLKERTGLTQYRKLLSEEKGILAIDDAGKGMVFAISEAVQAMGAERVMITGELSGMSDDLYASLNDALKMSLPPSREHIRIRKAKRGDKGLLEGASLIALDEFFYHKAILEELTTIQDKANF
ncbi:MAG: ROK family protein, partial [Spirochaetales bacterium]|nr:ROK family protein [Candidatus Physcosoma equi]